ncbi:excinuclease ATPase subunit [Porticoccus sp. W117]|uniref:excinuclease ATPase subunit n=1 Tax=Porticoccus sp. W117 TaxID=3054777 RepID=UPI00259681A6|nr:excinuclease ATPase subunit [Porticoccus sp. W117]MDM3869861.1 excinuclease ATPase subunit [Porticoccus sp. W117]
MKISTISTILAALMAFSAPAMARDTKHMYPLDDALNTPAAQEKLNQGIKFYFGDKNLPAVAKDLGTYTANKKTNAFGKSDKKACEWAFLSAMLSMQNRAVNEGGDAVIIHSYYKKNTVKSSTEYECGAGAIMAGVTLVGKVVKLK